MRKTKSHIRVKGRTLPVIFVLVFLLVGVGAMIAGFQERAFVNGEFSDWAETTAVIEDVWITSENIDITPDDRGRYDYRVEYGYVITFTTGSGLVTLNGSAGNTGKTRSSVSIPDAGYDFYEPGEEVSISYNPGDPVSYRLGTKAAIRAAAQNPSGIILGIVFLVLGLGFAFLIVRGILRDGREKKLLDDPNRTTS